MSDFLSAPPAPPGPPSPPDPAGGAGPEPTDATRSTLAWAMEDLEAGSRAAEAGDRPRALACYGRALDYFLSQGLHVMAASVAQRMIGHFPDVVRARGTLAVLSLAEGAQVVPARAVHGARAEFDAYVDAAREAGREAEAVGQLRRLVRVTESPLVREWIAEYLAALGDQRGAEEVFLAAYLEREGLRPARPASGDQRARWLRVLLPCREI